MNHGPRCVSLVGLTLLTCGIGVRDFAAADEPQSGNASIAAAAAKLQQVPPRSPEESRRAIRVREGFRVELVAAEPLVVDPVAVDFDENGRMYVVQLPPYNAYVLDEFPHRGSIRLLEDTDGDGHYDRAETFAREFSYPTAVACWDGGVLVGDAPDLLYLKDTDGDLKADVRKVVLTGFGSDRAGEAHLNSFRWGIDQRFHFSTSLSGGNVRAVGVEDAKTVSVRGRGMILDPRNPTRIELTSGGGQHGLSMDDWGRKFVCSNSVPAQTLMYDDRYAARSPHLPAPQAAVDIAPEGKFTKLFRISPAEPWRALRTQLRRDGKFRGSDEGGRPFGFFTGATGVTIYRGDAWPADFHGNLLVGDVANNLVYRANLESAGLKPIARRADAEREFLASEDIWFRPVQLAHAPDGSLLVLDMYRSLIEGAAFLPSEFYEFIDVVGGHDRGRIYRIVPEKFRRRPTPKLGQSSTEELVALLQHPNGWHRDTASRLLYQRQDKSAARGLRRLAREAESPIGRATALHALEGLDELDETTLLSGLADRDADVRVQALRLAEAFAANSAAVRAQLIALSNDDDLTVQYQLAFSLGSFTGPERNRALAQLARRDSENAWMRLAIQSSLAEGVADVFAALSGDPGFRATAHGRTLLFALATQIGSVGRSFEIATVLRVLAELPRGETSFREALVRALVKNVRGESRSRLLTAAGGEAAAVIEQMLADARKVIADRSAPAAERGAAVKALRFAPYKTAHNELARLLESREPQAVQLAAIETLGEFDDRTVAETLIAGWPAFSPVVRDRAAETLLSRPAWTGQFLSAVAERAIQRADVAPARIAVLKRHPDESIRERAASVFTDASRPNRAAVVAAYQNALQMPGDVARGRVLFRKVCAACHRLEDHGNAVGADLKAVSQRGDASVLLNVLDPNREVKPKFISYVVVTTDGRLHTGMIETETANGITLRRLDGTQVTIARADVEQLRGTGLSFMPEELEKQFDLQGAADLLTYLRSAGR